MQQIPIEEVLEEFRMKYRVVPEELKELEKLEVSEVDSLCSQPETFGGTDESVPYITHKSKSKHITFSRIIAIQAITAAMLAAVMIAAKLFNSQMYDYIVHFLT